MTCLVFSSPSRMVMKMDKLARIHGCMADGVTTPPDAAIGVEHGVSVRVSIGPGGSVTVGEDGEIFLGPGCVIAARPDGGFTITVPEAAPDLFAPAPAAASKQDG